jgi:hypothetical protein
VHDALKLLPVAASAAELNEVEDVEDLVHEQGVLVFDLGRAVLGRVGDIGHVGNRDPVVLHARFPVRAAVAEGDGDRAARHGKRGRVDPRLVKRLGRPVEHNERARLRGRGAHADRQHSGGEGGKGGKGGKGGGSHRRNLHPRT